MPPASRRTPATRSTTNRSSPGKNGGLANAFVYIQSGLEGKKFEPPQGSVVLDQHGLHVRAARPRHRAPRKPLDVKNSDTVSHNVHPMPHE